MTRSNPSAKPAPRPLRARNNAVPEKDLPLVEDIRLLGRILGDVIREQEGKSAFELIEQFIDFRLREYGVFVVFAVRARHAGVIHDDRALGGAQHTGRFA